MFIHITHLKYIRINKYIYIESWPKISAPLVNMIKEGCENESALLILLIYNFFKSQKSNLSLDNKSLKWGEIMADEVREHLTRDQRPFLHPESLQTL